MKKTLILTDNAIAYDLSLELLKLHGNIDIRQSPNGQLRGVLKLSVKRKLTDLISNYSLIISIHCKQLFPSLLVNSIRCINVHPGLNPYNRGWFPQVFSIINGLPAGVTIHEMDSQIDHGAIILQKKYIIESWDTSSTAYKKIMKIERQLVLDNYLSLRDNTYQLIIPKSEGNVNLKSDFNALKEINPNRIGTFAEFINILRALTFEGYDNAFFIDKLGHKVFVNITLKNQGQSQND